MMMGFGSNGVTDPMAPQNGAIPDGIIVGERIDIGEPVPNGEISPWAIGGIVAVLGGLVLFAVAIPFGVGAAAGAIAAPEGRRKRAAKWGALAGGLGGMAAYPIVYGLTGSQGVARSMSSLAPIALGAYMGLREKQQLEAERADF